MRKAHGQNSTDRGCPLAPGAKIDRLVYDLYGLTAEEIALVEGQE